MYKRLTIEDCRRSRFIRETKKRNFITKVRNFKSTKKNIYCFVLSPFRVFVIDFLCKIYCSFLVNWSLSGRWEFINY